ncbi:hypothetical protein LJB92_02755 [Bacteroidales bacterium OttesenSCG-928-M06]|nr:hypothetical protein [Bacteroidales bacterium OttesenSCG-928-M06]
MWLRFGYMWRSWGDSFLYLKYLLNLSADIIILFMQCVFWIAVAFIYELQAMRAQPETTAKYSPK